MSICPVHARPHYTCPIHAPARPCGQLDHAICCIPHPHVHSHLCSKQETSEAIEPILRALAQAPNAAKIYPQERGPDRRTRPTKIRNLGTPVFIDNQRSTLRKAVARRVHFDETSGSEKTRYPSSRGDDDNHSDSSGHAPIACTLPPPRPILTHHKWQEPPPIQPTVYILTYSKALTPTTASFLSLLCIHLPQRMPPIPHLYTIDCTPLAPPPAHICAQYSGLSPIVKAHMLQDSGACQAIDKAVGDLLDFGARERAKGNMGMREVSLSVCCAGGTHRSVAVADVVALRVRGEVRRMGVEEGVKVVVRHVHRVRGRKDEF